MKHPAGWDWAWRVTWHAAVAYAVLAAYAVLVLGVPVLIMWLGRKRP